MASLPIRGCVAAASWRRRLFMALTHADDTAVAEGRHWWSSSCSMTRVHLRHQIRYTLSESRILRISNLRIFKYEPSLAICALLLLLAAVDYVAALSEDIERTIYALT